ncbi:transposase [Streptomyces sp. NPDC014735]|uniref:transposase n=1 Tax=unclassified Streptomyces TaxID=2593676 RepID=UPI00370111DF
MWPTLRGTKAIVIKFDKETCRPCPVRDQCTRLKTGGRTLSPQPRELQEVLDHARLRQKSEKANREAEPVLSPTAADAARTRADSRR